MTNEEVVRGLLQFKHRLKDDGEVYSGYMFQQEYEALDIAIKTLESKDEVINRIEQVRDMDKNAGEYPYNRCIEIIREVMG